MNTDRFMDVVLPEPNSGCWFWLGQETPNGYGRLTVRQRSVEFRFREALRLQGLPDSFLSDAPFTSTGKAHAIGNGVPLPMGRAIARAVKRAIRSPEKPEVPHG